MRRKLLISCIALALAGCTVGPNYKRPAVAAPPAFRRDPQPLRRRLRWATPNGLTSFRTTSFVH